RCAGHQHDPVDLDAGAAGVGGRVRARAVRAARLPHRGAQQPALPRQLPRRPGGGVPGGDRGAVDGAHLDHEIHRRNENTVDGDTMARIMYEDLAREPGAPPPPAAGGDAEEAFQRYRAAIIEFVGRYWGQRLGEVQVGKVLLDLLAILRRHRVRVNPSFTIVNIAIAVTEGIGKQLDPTLDLMAEALPYFLSHPVDARAQPV